MPIELYIKEVFESILLRVLRICVYILIIIKLAKKWNELNETNYSQPYKI